MTITEQANFIQEALQEWAQGHGGKAVIVSDFVHLVESVLGMVPGAPQVFIAFDGEGPRDEKTSELGRVDRAFLAVVSCGRTMQIDKGKILTTGTAGGKPLFD